MNDFKADNKRIAKNTLLLYFRMILTMLVSLYTSRVVLDALGVSDYGIYSVVGGLVSMLSLISGSLTASISRYITYSLGEGEKKNIKNVFSTSVYSLLLISFLIVVLAESIGLWFLNNKMVIPEDRLFAARWLFQFSVLTFVINLISIPYNATIIAHEKMSIFAYVAIYESVIKLFIAFLIFISPIDRLVWYGLLLMVVALSVRLIYGWYCSVYFDECKVNLIIDKKLFKQMFGFAGWNFFGSGSYILMTQGVNMLLNIFFSVVVNAARGIAVQIEGAVTQFANNFIVAINPQLIKSYANGNYEHMYTLICKGAKYSYFLILLLSLPLLLEMDIVLALWLKTPPNYACSFARLTLIIALLSSLSNTLVTTMMATGNIKKYQLIVGGTGMLVFPLSYFAFRFGMSPLSSYYIQFFIFVFQLLFRLFLLKSMVGLSIFRYIREVLMRVILVSIFAVIVPISLHVLIDNMYLRFLLVIISSLFFTSIAIYLVGLEENEKRIFHAKVKVLIKKNS